MFAAQVMSPTGQESILGWVTMSYNNPLTLFGQLCLLGAVGG